MEKLTKFINFRNFLLLIMGVSVIAAVSLIWGQVLNYSNSAYANNVSVADNVQDKTEQVSKWKHSNYVREYLEKKQKDLADGNSVADNPTKKPNTVIENLTIYKSDGVTEAEEGVDYTLSKTWFTDYDMINLISDGLVLRGNGMAINYGLFINSDGLSQSTTLDNVNFTKVMTSEYICSVNTTYKESPSVLPKPIDYTLYIKGNCKFGQEGTFEFAPYGTIGVEGEGSLHIQDCGAQASLTVTCEHTDPFCAPIISFANLYLSGNVQYNISSKSFGIVLPYDWEGFIKDYSLYFEDNSKTSIKSYKQRGILLENTDASFLTDFVIKDSADVKVSSEDATNVYTTYSNVSIQDSASFSNELITESTYEKTFAALENGTGDINITTNGEINLTDNNLNMNDGIVCSNGSINIQNCKMSILGFNSGIIANGNLEINSDKEIIINSINNAIHTSENLNIKSGILDINSINSIAIVSGAKNKEKDAYFIIDNNATGSICSSDHSAICAQNYAKIVINSQDLYLSGNYQEKDSKLGALYAENSYDQAIESKIQLGDGICVCGSPVLKDAKENVDKSVAVQESEGLTFKGYTYFIDEENNLENSANTLVFTCKHDMEKFDQIDPTYNNQGCKAYYHCKRCNKYFEDEKGSIVIEDLNAWKSEGGNGYIAPLKVPFTAYKESVKQKCDAILLPDDPQSVKDLIDKAKADIDAYKYQEDANMTFEENEAKIDEIYNKLVKDVDDVRQKEKPVPGPDNPASPQDVTGNDTPQTLDTNIPIIACLGLISILCIFALRKNRVYLHK